MAQTLLYRLFRYGRMPAEVRDRMAGESILVEAEAVVLIVRRNGRVPGAIGMGSIRRTSGSFAVTERRVIATGRKRTLVDWPFEPRGDGALNISIDGEGLHLSFDLNGVEGCSGEMRLDFRHEIPPEVLECLPRRDMACPVEPGAVRRMFIGYGSGGA